MSEYAPIALFTYCRLANTIETIECLKKNKEAQFSDLIIFSDAPKNEKAAEGVERTREYLHTIEGFRTVEIVERSKNLGLANSIVDGVSKVVNKYGKIIVLEDDLSVSQYFLQYMNEGLDRYEKRDDIISIHGYIYPHKYSLAEAVLVKGADCWGWATWKRGWDIFNFNAAELYNDIISTHRQKEFTFNYSYPYLDLLKKQINGSANSWAVCWYASAFLKNKYTLYPGKTLVRLNDTDGAGATHGTTPEFYNSEVKETPINWNNVDDVKESELARKAFELFFNSRKSWKRLCYERIINSILLRYF